MLKAPKLCKTFIVVTFLLILLTACRTETIEVTRIKIMERRVIERIEVTVQVTRIHRVVETPIPTLEDLIPANEDANLTPSPSPPPNTPTAAAPRPTAAATVASPSSAQEVGEDLLGALRSMEQTMLDLIQALNSDPLPGAQILELYAAIENAPTFSVPESEAMLQSIYARYREQVDYMLGQSTDLRTHLAEIEAGQANETEVSPIHLGLARDATSAGTSTIQGLIRELEDYLAAQP